MTLAFITTTNVSAQETGDVVFCWNVERQLLEVQNVEYVSNEDLLDPNNTGDRFPVITAITTTSTSTTVSGTITFRITANDDIGINHYEFIADLPSMDYLSIQKSGTSSTSTLQFPYAGLWRTYFYVRDTSGQSISATGPEILVE